LTDSKDSKVLQSVHEKVKDIQDDTSSIRKDLSSQQIAELLDWISPMDVAAQLQENWKRYHVRTGTWFLESPQFKDWVKTPGTTLFCPGHPGTGKTIMSTLVIDHLLRTTDGPDTSVAYVFLNAKSKGGQNADALLLCILKQILSAAQSGPTADCIKRLQRSREKHKSRPVVLAQHEIIEELRLLCSDTSNIYIVVDGLDESDDSTITSLIRAINSLKGDEPRRIHFMATSRPIPTIRAKFEDMPFIEVRAKEEDVTTYLKAQIPHMSNCVRKDKHVQEQIIHGIVNVAKGVFLIARLHVEALSAKRTIKAVKLAIQELDGPLRSPAAGSNAAYDLAYEATMDRIMAQRPEDSELATRVLMWVGLSPSPLTVTELQHAMAVELRSTAFDTENIVDGDELISLCAGLVITRASDARVYFAHHTALEYFGRTRRNWTADPYRSLAEVCVTFLSFDVFLLANEQYWPETLAQNRKNPWQMNQHCEKYEKILQDLAQLDSAFPFYEHASCYWAFYLRNVEDLDSIDDAEGFLARFLGAPYAVKHANIRASYQPTAMHVIESRMGFTGLHFTAMFGLQKLTRALVEDGGTNLESGYTPVVGLPGQSNDDVFTPLHLAIYYGHSNVVETLIDSYPEDVDRRAGANRDTPLIVAVDQGRNDIIKLLLDTKLTDVNGKEYLTYLNGGSRLTVARPLLLAVEGYRHYNHFRDSEARLCVVRTLLDAPGIDKHAADSSRDENALHVAARYGTPGTVQLLVDHGLDISARNQSGHTPLMVAAGMDHLEVVQLLAAIARKSATWEDVEGPELLGHAVRWRAKSVIDYLSQAEKASYRGKDTPES
jgi:ankyrin repeat protein